jgi:hypothetical protein
VVSERNLSQKGNLRQQKWRSGVRNADGLGPQPSGKLPTEQPSPPYPKVIMVCRFGSCVTVYEPVAPKRIEQSAKNSSLRHGNPVERLCNSCFRCGKKPSAPGLALCHTPPDASSCGHLEPTTEPADEPGFHCQAISRQSKEAVSNRRDAMNAETGHSQPPENLSLKGGWFELPLPCSFLRGHRASAVRLHGLQPNMGKCDVARIAAKAGLSKQGWGSVETSQG